MSDKPYLAFHLSSIHLNELKDFVCDLCGCKTKHKGNLLKHIRTKHMHSQDLCFGIQHSTNPRKRPQSNVLQLFNLVDGKYFCEMCDKKYDSRQKFNYHNHSMHKDNKTCKICDKTFCSYINLNIHIRAVLQKKTNKFSNRALLESHANTHTGKI